MTEDRGPDGARARPGRARILGLAALVVVLVLAAWMLPVKAWLIDFVAWTRDLGPTGVALYAATYIGATVLLVPGSLLTLGAGVLWGPLWGVAVVSPVSVTAACCAFLVGRSVARTWVESRVQHDPRFAAIDAAVGREGLKIVTLLRLSPAFPFALSNYVLGLTQVRLRDFALGSLVGMLPGTFVYVYFGSLLGSVADLAGGAPTGADGVRKAMLGLGFVATVAVTIYVTRLARRALAAAIPDDPSA